MSIQVKDFDKVEAWKGAPMLPLGWNTVTIETAEEGRSSGDNPQVELQYIGDGGSMRDWVVFTEASLGKAKALLKATGHPAADKAEFEFPTHELPGRSLRVFVGEEQDYKDPSKMRRRVQAYERIGSSDVPGSDDGHHQDDDIPF